MAETIKQWADRRRVGVTVAKRLLRELYPDRDFRSPDRRLDKEEVSALDAEHERVRRESAVADNGRVSEPETPPEAEDSVLKLEISRVRDGARRAARSVRFQLHPDFLEWFTGAPSGPQRAATLRALESMTANGRPNRVKGVKGVNQGWLRTPVGGTSGMQWYLWYATRGAKPVGDRLAEGEFLIRAIRHHDDTGDHIGAGRPSDWMPWTPRELIEEYDRPGSESAAPLTGAQTDAARCGSPVQIVRGTPGAGKTTSLLHGVRRLPGRVLYMTYGRSLAERARNWLRSFATGDAPAEVEAVADVLGALAGATPPRDPTLAALKSELSRALDARLKDLSPWCNGKGLDHVPLYDELHGQLFGRVTASTGVGLPPDGTRTLLPRESDYVSGRKGVIGEAAARSAWKAAWFLDDATIRTLFPGPLAARRAIERLRAGTVPEKLGHPDWIVIDEAQDLTLVETEAIVEFARAVAVATGKRPGLRLAGDEGQTLRPTGFTWADLKVLLAQRVEEPESSVLDCNLRSAREVAIFVEQLTRATYPRLRKGLRPGGQRRGEIDPVEGGEVCVLRVPRKALPDVLTAAKSAGAVIQPGREIPDLVADAAKEAAVQVLTGESAKGLDFDSVVVIGLGDVIARMHALAHEGDVEELAAEQARSLADHARVAASRAVSRLVLVEVEDGGDGDAARAALDEVFVAEVGDLDGGARDEPPESISIEALAERLEADTGDSISRLVAALRLADDMLDRDPAAALRSADEAASWLKRTGRTAALGDELRQQVHRARGRARVAVALQGILAERARDDLVAAQRSFRAAGDAAAADRVGDLARLLRPEDGPVTPARLREALAARDALETGKEENAWLHGLVSPVLNSRITGVLDDIAPRDAVQARVFLDALVGTNLELDEQKRALDGALLRVCEALARSSHDARLAIRHANGRTDVAWLRVTARAWTTLSDSQAPAAWVTAGDAEEGLATLRSWGRIREAAAFAAEQGLAVPPAVAAAVRLLDATDAMDPASMTPAEQRSAFAEVESKLAPAPPARGRRT